MSESKSRESEIGDKEFKSEISLKVSIGMSLLLKISGSEPIKSLPRPESGDPRESGMSEKRSGVDGCWKISSQSNMDSSWVMEGRISSTLGPTGMTGTGSGTGAGTAGIFSAATGGMGVGLGLGAIIRGLGDCSTVRAVPSTITQLVGGVEVVLVAGLGMFLAGALLSIAT